MRKNLKKTLLTLLAVVSMTVIFCFGVSAAKDGYYTYKIAANKATITSVDSSISGNVIIPDKLGVYPVTTIERDAFYKCKEITSLTINSSIIYIEPGSFYGCEKLKYIEVSKENKSYCNDDYGVLFNKNKTELIRYPEGATRTSYDIPNSVKKIETDAFASSINLKNIFIPNSVNVISKWAFEDCYNLTNIKIPEGITTISEGVFSSCVDLKQVKIPESVTSIELAAFAGCGFDSIVLPSKLKNIGEEAFMQCCLESIIIPNSVTTIEKSAFYGCMNLREISISNNVKKINEGTFCLCRNLKRIILPEGLKIIGKYAFSGCDSLEIITFPASLEVIEEGAFEEKVKDVYCFGNPEDIHVETNIGLATSDIHIAKQKNSKKATMTNCGVQKIYCSFCEEYITQTISNIDKLTLSATSYIYDGKNKTPKLTVKDANGNVLTKNVDYKITVASKRAGIGRYTVKVTFMGKYSGTKNLYFYILPGKPATVKSASQGTTSNKLTWSAVPGATGYTLYYYSNSKKAYKKINTTTNTSYTVKGLLTGTKYTFKIVAYGETASGKVYDSETYALLKSATKTKTPELTKVTASSTKGKAYVYHTDVKGETGYTVYYSTSSTTGFKKYANFGADTTMATITGLTSGKTYYFKVRTYIKTDSGYVYSPWSNIKGVKVK